MASGGDSKQILGSGAKPPAWRRVAGRVGQVLLAPNSLGKRDSVPHPGRGGRGIARPTRARWCRGRACRPKRPIILEFYPMSTHSKSRSVEALSPDPLQNSGAGRRPAGPSLKNEMMLPASWTRGPATPLRSGPPGAQYAGSKVWLVSLGPSQASAGDDDRGGRRSPLSWWRSMDRLPVSRIPSRRRRRWRRPSRPFRVGSRAVAGVRRMGIGICAARARRSRWWASAWRSPSSSRVDQGPLRDGKPGDPGAHRGRTHQVWCAPRRRVLGWATGNLPEPRNNPQIGMANMRAIMPAAATRQGHAHPQCRPLLRSVNLPRQQRRRAS